MSFDSVDVADLGHDLTRSTIAGMEAGRRGTVAVADLLVLAKALGVPPPLLVFPVGQVQEVEVSPGAPMDVLDAANWWSAMPAEPGTVQTRLQWLQLQAEGGPLRPVALIRSHQRAVRNWNDAMSSAANADDEQVSGFSSRQAEFARSAIENDREALRREGFVLPPLPPGLVEDDRNRLLPDGLRSPEFEQVVRKRGGLDAP